MCVSPQDLGCGGGGVGGLELWVLMATEPSRLDVITANGNHSQTRRRDVTDRCEHLPARRGGGVGVRAEMKRESLNVRKYVKHAW